MLQHLLAAGQQDEGIGRKGYDTNTIRDRDSATRSNGLEVGLRIFPLRSCGHYGG